MGSFNASCMVTGVNINSNGEVLFLPFKQNHPSYLEKKEILFQAKAQSFVESSEYMFTPYLLPIRGRYDTYGRIEEIVRDSNVQAIEAHFGIGIDTFINILTCSREFGSRFSEFSEVFLSKEVLDIQGNYGSFATLLQALGFTSDLSEGHYVSRHPNCSFTLIWNENENAERSSSSKYTVRFKSGVESKKHDNYNQELFALAISEDDFFLGVSEENQEVLRELYGLTGAFVHKAIYDVLSTNAVDGITQVTPLPDVRKFYENVTDEAEAVDKFEIFMDNLKQSNRMLSLSKTANELGVMTQVKFHSGLLDVIQQEINRL